MRAADVAALLVLERRDLDLARLRVDGAHHAVEVAIAPAEAVGAIADLVDIGIERACRHFVQQRLPDMGLVAVHQDDIMAPAPEALAELGRQLQPGRPAAHDHDLRLQGEHVSLLVRHWRPPDLNLPGARKADALFDQICLAARQCQMS